MTQTKTETIKKNKTKCIHIFRRDYRIVDNTSLISASKKYKDIIPIFIFTYKQIRDNSLKSEICVKFLVESLKDLDKQLKKVNSKLRIYYGDEFQIIEHLIKSNSDIGAISFNQDYTKYSKSRDNIITKLAFKNNIEIISDDDYCLHPIGTITTNSGKPYTKFTPFYNKCLENEVRKPDMTQVKFISSTIKINGHSEYTAPLDSMYDEEKIKHVSSPEKGGRNEGIKILNKITSGSWKDYNDKRDLLIYKTTHLSPYNKFGCLSIREIFHIAKKKLGINSGIIRQLIWRDFYYNLGNNNPQIFSGAMSGKFNKISWEGSSDTFKKWTQGKTGFPIVDACISEIINTGYMHNRGRLIVSNFLTRILHHDWRKGEHWFAKMLYDYDPIQNNFGWEVNAAVSGTESRPLTQTILNPWIQSKKYDPKAEYIKHWLPELKDITPQHLHRWDLYHDKYKLIQTTNNNKTNSKSINYIKPIVNYEDEKKKNIVMYRKYI